MQPVNNQTPLADECRLNNYKIIRQLGKGGFGITYLVLDESLNKPIALKEYFPDALSFRTSEQMHVSVLSTDKLSDFEEGLRRFEREAMMLSEFKHPNIIQVLGLFKANNTAYFAMDYIDGLSLDDYQKQKNRQLTEQEIIKQCLPVLNGLKEVHSKGMLHLDIKPDNIIQTKYGQPLLIDFGGARVVTSQHSQDLSQHSSMVATDGYAPTEQYSLIAEQTPATDLYAFGMTLYKLMVPQAILPKSNDRQSALVNEIPDPLRSIRSIAKGYSETLYQVVEACTKVRQSQRPQSVEELQNLLAPLYSQTQSNEPKNGAHKTQIVEPVKPIKDSKKTAAANPSNPKNSGLKGIAISAVLALTLGGIYQYSQNENELGKKEVNVANTLPKELRNMKVLETSAVAQRHKNDAMLSYATAFSELYKQGVAVSEDGLMWMRCSVGQTLVGNVCEGSVKQFSWVQAVSMAKDYELAGYSDWRVPDLKELYSIVDCKHGKGSIEITLEGIFNDEKSKGGCLKENFGITVNGWLFPSIAKGYWSSSKLVAMEEGWAWAIDFYTGEVRPGNPGHSLPVRLVRNK